MIRRPPRSTLSSSSAASDVYKRQILSRSPTARLRLINFAIEIAASGPSHPPPAKEAVKAVTKIAIILGRTRHGRNGAAVARWFYELAVRRTDAEFELVDPLDDELPLFDETWPPSLGMYQHAHTKRWAAKVAEFAGYVFVTAEYNLGIRGALKNAIDFVYAERNNKVAGFVSYGQAGGVHAVDHLRLVAAELQVATGRAQVSLSPVSYTHLRA